MYGIYNLDIFYPTIATQKEYNEVENDQNNSTDSSTIKSSEEGASEINQNSEAPMETDEQSVISQQPDVISGECDDDPKQAASTSTATDPSQQSQAQSTPPPKSQPMSLRMLMYLCLSNANNDNLFHAVYQTTEKGKIYVLCTQNNRDEALVQLHHLEEAASCYFSEDVMSQIFVGHKGMTPYVKDYPKVSNHYQNYASVLVDMAGLDDNPQGGGDSGNHQEMEQTNQQGFSAPKHHPSYSNVAQADYQKERHQSPTKRQRDGAFVTPTRTSRLPKGFDANIQENNQLNATVTESIARMRNIEQSQKDHDSKIEGISKIVESYSTDMHSMGQDISSMGSAIASHSSSIRTLLEAQSAQQKTIEKMDTTLSKTQSSINEIVEFNKKYILPAFTKAPHGGGETES